jgi:beta-alanine--pyruvate transaminase
VGFGGISVGGMVNNRKFFGAQLPGVDHLPHTHDLAHNAWTRGEPAWGAHLADELERIVALHDASTIAAVIVEPVAGSTGVLIPPQGYLKRLREICTKHGILLIFDEVITGFGRLGAPFGAEYFGVVPDLITMAKGLTNGAIPMGAVAASKGIYEAFMQGPESAIELFHGYTYSAHPVAAPPASPPEVYRARAERALDMADCRAMPCVHEGPNALIDLRNLGLIAPSNSSRSRARRVRAATTYCARIPERRVRRHHRAVAAVDHRAQAHEGSAYWPKCCATQKSPSTPGNRAPDHVIRALRASQLFIRCSTETTTPRKWRDLRCCSRRPACRPARSGRCRRRT